MGIDAVHRSILLGVWKGSQPRDARFAQALRALGISAGRFDELAREARKVTRSLPRNFILTPTSVGRRR